MFQAVECIQPMANLFQAVLAKKLFPMSLLLSHASLNV